MPNVQGFVVYNTFCNGQLCFGAYFADIKIAMYDSVGNISKRIQYVGHQLEICNQVCQKRSIYTPLCESLSIGHF